MISTRTGSGIVGLAVAGYLAAVLVKGRGGTLLSVLATEKGYLKWGAAAVFWLLLRSSTDGRVRVLIDSIGGAAAAMGIVMSAGGVQKLSDSIHTILSGQFGGGGGGGIPSPTLPATPTAPLSPGSPIGPAPAPSQP